MCNHCTGIGRACRDKMVAKTDRVILNLGICLLLFFITVTKIDYCYASQYPAAHISIARWANWRHFLFWSTARLLSEEMAALAWYVNGSKQPIESRLLSEDCWGYSVDGSIEGGYALVNIFKEEPYEASYICAVLHISDNIRSNAVEVLFKDLTSDNITATCISNGSNSLTVAVNLHKRLQERQ